MPAYLIANVIIKDTDKFKDYMKATPPIIKQFGGRFLVRGGDFEVCEGNWNPKRLVLVEEKGKCKMVAIVASIGKLLCIMNIMLKNNQKWQPNFVKIA